MILSFSKDSFMKAIIRKEKDTTFRKDVHNRWKEGREIQFWRGNPRNKGSFYFGTGVCSSVSKVIMYTGSKLLYTFRVDLGMFVEVSGDELEDIAKWDGFETVEEFFTYFGKDSDNGTWKGVHILFELNKDDNLKFDSLEMIDYETSRL